MPLSASNFTLIDSLRIIIHILVAGGGRNQLIEDSTNERGEVNSQIDIDGNQPRVSSCSLSTASTDIIESCRQAQCFYWIVVDCTAYLDYRPSCTNLLSTL